MPSQADDRLRTRVGSLKENLSESDRSPMTAIYATPYSVERVHEQFFSGHQRGPGGACA